VEIKTIKTYFIAYKDKFMFRLYGLEYHKINLIKLLDIKDPKNLEITKIKDYYNHFLEKNSVFEQPITWQHPKITNFDHLKNDAPLYCEKNFDHFKPNPSSLELKIKNDYFQLALNQLAMNQSELYDLVCFYMKIIVINYLTEYIEGTTDETLGLSCLDFKDHYKIQDYYELLVHQLVHKMTFIDNRLHPQLLPEYKQFVIETPFVHKAGGNHFSLYIGFHSYLVGVEILHYRKITHTLDFQGNYHGNTASIMKKCQRGYQLLSQYKHYFTAHGQEILLRANEFLSTHEEK
jgi:hypothetical protein